MMTNTYSPHVGGVARSVEAFANGYRQRGHRTLVVAPVFDDMAPSETDVIRLPAIQRFNGSDFSVVLPVSAMLRLALNEFEPDIVHSHHPFLIGSTALRIARMYALPLVFTHHTMYERYTHYVPGDSRPLKRFVIQLTTCYANLCDQVFAPSESVAELLRKREIKVPIAVVPTGVDTQRFGAGDGVAFRRMMNIPAHAFVVGHLGRLALEKNLEFLGQSVIRFLKKNDNAYFLLVGKGDAESLIHAQFAGEGLSKRLYSIGVLQHPMLASAYQAMDVFAFCSLSETQGMVLAEAMAAGVPVVALDAPGVREIVRDHHNGRLLNRQNAADFAAALSDMAKLSARQRRAYCQAALASADEFSTERSVSKALAIYEALVCRAGPPWQGDDSAWNQLLGLIKGEWSLIKSYAEAAGGAFEGSDIDSR